MRVRRFTLIVYHQGYIGWRSDRQFPEGNARRDFSQRNNRVRLEKWREGLLHHRHLVFLGGGAATRSAAQGEVQAAVMELEGRRPVPTPGAPEGPAAPARKQPAGRHPAAVRGRAARGDRLRRRVRHRQAEGPAHHRLLRQPALQGARAARELRRRPAGLAAGDRRPRPSTASCWASCRAPGSPTSWATARCGPGPAEVLGVAFLSREKGVVVSVSCGVRQCPDAGDGGPAGQAGREPPGRAGRRRRSRTCEAVRREEPDPDAPAPAPAPAPGGASPPAAPPTENPQQ